MTLDREIDEEEEIGTRKSLFKPEMIGIIIAVLIILIFKGRWGVWSADYATFVGFSIIMLIVFLKLAWAFPFYKSSKIVWNGGHSTTTGRYESVGNYIALRLGGVDWSLFSGQQTNQGVLFIPRGMEKKIGRSWGTTNIGQLYKIDDLPVMCKSYILENKINPPYIAALVDERQILATIKGKNLPELTGNKDIEEIDVMFLLEHYKQSNRQINEFLDWINLKFGSVEKFIANAGRTMSKADRGRADQTLKKIFMDDDKE